MDEEPSGASAGSDEDADPGPAGEEHPSDAEQQSASSSTSDRSVGVPIGAPTLARTDYAQAEDDSASPWEPPPSHLWKNKRDHVVVALSYNLDMYSIFVDLPREEERGSSDAVMILETLCLGMPLLHMQIFLGKYSHRTCLYLGRMLPLLHGIGMLMVIFSIMCMLRETTRFSTTLSYVIQAAREPWAECQEVGCIPMSHFEKCSPQAKCAKRNISTFIYYKTLKNKKSTTLGAVTVVILALTPWIVTTLFNVKSWSFVIKVVKVLFSMSMIIMVGITLIVIMMSPQARSVTGESLTVLLPESMSWVTLAYVLAKSLSKLYIATGGHILYGSYLAHSNRSSLQAVHIIALQLVIVLFGSFLSRLCINSLQKAIEGNLRELGGTDILFFVFPTFLSTLNFPVLIGAFYFLYFTVTLNRQICHFQVVCESILDYFPLTKKNRLYLIIGVCIVGAAYILTSLSPDISSAMPRIMTYTVDFGGVILIFLQTFLITYTYSFQHFWDDIHFISGAQPALFWKIGCLINPPILLVTAILYDDGKTEYKKEKICTILACFLVVVVATLYKFIQHVRKPDLAGFFRMDERWGPRNPHQRRLRRLYNPRFEIRSRRRCDACDHRCIAESEVLDEIVAYEYKCSLQMDKEQEVVGGKSRDEIHETTIASGGPSETASIRSHPTIEETVDERTLEESRARHGSRNPP